jgi:predicted HTH transcriptional regulator
LEKIRKEKAKRARQEEKEEQKKQKEEEKNAREREAKYNRYHDNIKNWVKENKYCHLDDLAEFFGLSAENIIYILSQLCKHDPEFELSLWSGNQFLYVTRSDYRQFEEDLKKEGKISVHQGKVYY